MKENNPFNSSKTDLIVITIMAFLFLGTLITSCLFKENASKFIIFTNILFLFYTIFKIYKQLNKIKNKSHRKIIRIINFAIFIAIIIIDVVMICYQYNNASNILNNSLTISSLFYAYITECIPDFIKRENKTE